MTSAIIELLRLKITRLFACFVVLALCCNWLAAKVGLQYWQPQYHTDALLIYAYQHAPQPYDIVFLGTSRTKRAILSRAVERELAKLSGREFRVFNLGQRGQPVFTYEIVLRDILRKKHPPRMVIAEIGVTQLNSHSTDRRDAMRYYCDLAEIRRFLPYFKGTEDVYAALFGLFRGVTTFLTYLWDNPGSKENADILRAIYAQGGGHILEPSEDPYRSLADLDEKTFNRKREKRMRKYRKRYLNRYSIRGLSDKSVNNIIDLCHDNNITLIFLGLPLAEAYREAVDPSENSMFLNYMERVCKANNVEFFNFGKSENSFSHADFMDFGHLNMTGAEKFSRTVSGDILYPYLKDAAQ